jgi:hypothetical protein
VIRRGDDREGSGSTGTDGRTDRTGVEGEPVGNANPARIYALVFGVVLVVAGIIGFLYESTFTDDESVRDAVLGVLDVNGWHNVVHIATGALGLLAFAAGAYAARAYALGLGAVYIAVAIWGFVIGDGDSILSVVPVNTADNFLHLLIGIAGLAAGAATPATTRGLERTA